MHRDQDISEYFAKLAVLLRAGKMDASHTLREQHFNRFYWPWHWREEAITRAEYLIKYARAAGIDAVEDVMTGDLRCRPVRESAPNVTQSPGVSQVPISRRLLNRG